jgi:hypothetical protein
MIQGVVILFVLSISAVAHADCGVLGKQARDADARLEIAINRYKGIAAELPRSPDRSGKYSEALSANSELLEALNGSIASLEQGKAEGCFGQQYDTWNSALESLKARRTEFLREREALLKAAPAVERDKNNKSTAGKTSIEFINEKLDATLKSMNDKAPIEVDSKTLLTKAQRTGMVIIYTYKISISKSMWISSMEDSLIQSTLKKNCTNERVRTLLNLGYEYRHVSFDPTGLLLANALVTAKKCENLTVQGSSR